MKILSEERLQQALDLLSAGHDVDEVLSHFPRDAEALRPFLLTAANLAVHAVQPPAGAEARSRQRFLSAAAEMRAAGRPLRRSYLFAWLRPLVAVTAVLILLGTSLGLASTAAMPGDPLYGTKLLLEDIRLSWVQNDDQASTLQASFQQERLREVRAVLLSNRDVAVQFEGVVQHLKPNGWVISGVWVLRQPETAVFGEITEGMSVLVRGHTRLGAFYADELLVTGNFETTVEGPPPVTPAESGEVTPAVGGTVPAATPLPPEQANDNDQVGIPPVTTPEHDKDRENDNGGDDDGDDETAVANQNSNDHDDGDHNNDDGSHTSSGNDNDNDNTGSTQPSGGDDAANDNTDSSANENSDNANDNHDADDDNSNGSADNNTNGSDNSGGQDSGNSGSGNDDNSNDNGSSGNDNNDDDDDASNDNDDDNGNDNNNDND